DHRPRRYLLRHRRHQGRAPVAGAPRPARRLRLRPVDGRHLGHRRGRRLDLLGRLPGRPPGRAPLGRRRSRPRLLRPGRDGADRDRRRRPPRAHRPRLLPRRDHAAPSDGGGSGADQPDRRPLGVDVDTACLGLYRIVADTMSGAVRSATVEKGYDPRRFTVVSFGGAGGLFIAEICRMMGIGDVVVPDDAAVFSAAGLLWADAVRSFVRTVNWIIPAAPLAPLNATLEQLGAQARAALVEQGFDEDDIDVRFEDDVKWAG